MKVQSSKFNGGTLFSWVEDENGDTLFTFKRYEDGRLDLSFDERFDLKGTRNVAGEFWIVDMIDKGGE